MGSRLSLTEGKKERKEDYHTGGGGGVGGGGGETFVLLEKGARRVSLERVEEKRTPLLLKKGSRHQIKLTLRAGG